MFASRMLCHGRAREAFFTYPAVSGKALEGRWRPGKANPRKFRPFQGKCEMDSAHAFGYNQIYQAGCGAGVCRHTGVDVFPKKDELAAF